MEYSLETEFQSDLIPGEKIYWSGQPDPSVIFTVADSFLIPFSLIWGGFWIVWELGGLLMYHLAKPSRSIPLSFTLFGIAFGCVAFYMIIGRFFFKAWKKKRTFYAVTNSRILIVTETFGRQLQAQFLNQTPVISKSIGPNGIGLLSFSPTGGFGLTYGNTGMEFVRRQKGYGILVFYDIPQAEMIYQMICQLRNQALATK